MNIQKSKVENSKIRKNPAIVQEQRGIDQQDYDVWQQISDNHWQTVQSEYWHYMSSILNKQND